MNSFVNGSSCVELPLQRVGPVQSRAAAVVVKLELLQQLWFDLLGCMLAPSWMMFFKRA